VSVNLLPSRLAGTSVARGLSGYIDSLFDDRMKAFWMGIMPLKVDFLAEYPDILSFGIVLLLSVILAAGVKESSWLHSFFTTINMVTIVVLLIAGSIKANPKNWAIAKEDIPEGVRGGEGGFMPYGIAGVMAGAAKCFYGFVGFDCVATAGEEAKNAKRNIPLAVVMTLMICVIVYMLIAAVLCMMWPYYDLNPEAPFPHVFIQLGWKEIRWIVSIGAVFALFSALLGALFSLPRILYSMSNDGLLFTCLNRVNLKTQTPLISTMLSGFFSALMAALFSLHQLVDMLSIGTLLAYTIVAISVLVLHYSPVENSNSKQLQRQPSISKPSANEPSEATSNICKLSIFVYFLLSIILGCLVTLLAITTINIVLMSIVSFLMLVITIIIARQPANNSAKLSFRVPLVPFLPCISIFANTYLMLQLDGPTWIRFGVWMVIGKRNRNSIRK